MSEQYDEQQTEAPEAEEVLTDPETGETVASQQQVESLPEDLDVPATDESVVTETVADEVEDVTGQPGWVGRLAELGIRQGSRVQVVQPGSPCLLNVSGCRLCLRPGDCSQILVRPVGGVAAAC